MPGKIKVNFKMPPETAAEKMYRKHQELRKKSGLPDPEHYKKMAAQKQKEIDDLRKEETEQLDEMPESSMKTRDVHAHLKKSGWSLKRTGGGHDVYAHPKSEKHIAVPRHKQLKAPLIRGIMKASRVSEEAEIEEQLHKKGKFVSGPVKKPYKSPTVVTPIREAKDSREYDYEGEMAVSQLRSLIFNAEDLIEMMEDNTNLPEWVQTKITLAEDYVSTAANYLRGELMEAANPAQQAAIAINMKKKGIKPKNEEVEVNEGIVGRVVSKVINKLHSANAKKPLPQASDRREYEKPKMEETELTEGRPSQRHPLEGHEYHKKTDAELEYIGKDAHKAAEAMKGHNTTAENKYRDQANDAATVRYFRKKSGTPDWYKKKYGHVKEESEYLEEKNVPTSPEKWAQAKAQAKQKFDVYPSAYANGWAAKKYKEMGGGWKSVNEDTDDPSAAARTLSRKAQIVRDAAKGKKKDQEDASDKFQKDPELSSDMQKT